MVAEQEQTFEEYQEEVFSAEAALWLEALWGGSPGRRAHAGRTLMANLETQRAFAPDDAWWQGLMDRQIELARNRLVGGAYYERDKVAKGSTR